MSHSTHAMSLRSFTVFRDTPTPHTKATKPSTSSSAANATTIDKENLHPVTGARPIVDKKRKTTALSTKSHTPLAIKSQGDASEPSTKKRKSTKGKTTKKDGKVASRKSSKKISRKGSPLPVVDEAGESERESERIMRAEIDAKCYELTVQPLADVTEAFDEVVHSFSAVARKVVVEDKATFRMVKEPSCEPEISEDFLTLASSSRLSLTRPCTPEPKKAQPAFTFSSPSRSGERFRAKSAEKSTPCASPQH